MNFAPIAAGRNERPPSFPKTRRSLFGDDDVPLEGALDGTRAAVFVDGEVNRGHFGKLMRGKGKLSDNLIISQNRKSGAL